jgi:gamma-D-glutamyl-L-lysine dipeptidyl-peptidase
MILSFAVCNAAVVPLRKEPSHRAEQISQLLFGERAEVLISEAGDWAYVRCLWDDYEGWCKLTQLRLLTKKEFYKSPKYIVAGHTSRLVFDEGEMLLPLGAELFGMKTGHISVHGEKGRFKGKKEVMSELRQDAAIVRETAMSYLHAPYQWGGRVGQGIDCSGLSQVVLKMTGTKIARDASQQVLQGETVAFLQEAVCGDLAFFDNAEGRINHVGILIDSNTIIHATESSGAVVLDKIDQQGIVSRIHRRRTHSLRMIRRMFTS